MIYTIRCRAGHCGARFQTDDRDPLEGPVQSAMNIEKAAEKQGWYRENLSGWVCPFHAPKAAADKPIPKILSKATPGEDYTICSQSDCCNANLCTTEGVLKHDGWHRIGVGPWYCPACWKITQPEPEEEDREVDVNAQAAHEVTLEDIRELAREEIKAAFRRIYDKCTSPNPVDDRLESLISQEAELPF